MATVPAAPHFFHLPPSTYTHVHSGGLICLPLRRTRLRVCVGMRSGIRIRSTQTLRTLGNLLRRVAFGLTHGPSTCDHTHPIVELDQYRIHSAMHQHTTCLTVSLGQPFLPTPKVFHYGCFLHLTSFTPAPHTRKQANYTPRACVGVK
jgi:hypothetical protein